MSNYIQSVKQWCDHILEGLVYNNFFISKNNQEIKEDFMRFRSELSNGLVEDSIAEKRAFELYEELKKIIEESRKQNQSNSVPIGGHTLPPLPYDYAALEPYISREIMRLHHDIHHKSYVDGLNTAEKELQKMRQTGDYSLIKHWEREAAFNGAGHYLHSIFWEIMSPKGGGKPHGELRQEIDRSFGSFSQFKKQFTEAANKVEGSGWAILVWSPRSRRLEILQAEKHQNLSQWDIIPLLVLDVWEHSYYLQYKNDRKKYIENWWNIVNWPEVERRFQAAKNVTWTAY